MCLCIYTLVCIYIYIHTHSDITYIHCYSVCFIYIQYVCIQITLILNIHNGKILKLCLTFFPLVITRAKRPWYYRCYDQEREAGSLNRCERVSDLKLGHLLFLSAQ